MTRDSFIAQVKLKMDELTPFNEGLFISDGSNTNPIYNHIDNLIDESVYEIILQGASHLFPSKLASGEISIVNNIGIIVMPIDFIKIQSIESPEWERPVTRTITDSDPVYLQQKNKYTRAGSAKPIVALRGDNGTRFLEIYTIKSTTGAKVKYIGKLTIDQIPETVIPALAWYTASKVYATMEDAKNSEAAIKQYSNSITIRSL